MTDLELSDAFFDLTGFRIDLSKITSKNFTLGREPFSDCPICGGRVDHTGRCGYCATWYGGTLRYYDIPEPFNQENYEPRHWMTVQLIKACGEAAGKTKFEINREIFSYAYKTVYPNATGESPFMYLCNIPSAPHTTEMPYIDSRCPACGEHDVYERSYCSTCGLQYGDERFHNYIPAPFTQRIYSTEHWAKVYSIRKAGKIAGKTKAQIDEEVSQYAKQAVAELQMKYSDIKPKLPQQPSPPQPAVPPATKPRTSWLSKVRKFFG